MTWQCGPHSWHGSVGPVLTWQLRAPELTWQSGPRWRGRVGPSADVALWPPVLTWQPWAPVLTWQRGARRWRGSVPLLMWHCGPHCWPCKFHPLIPNTVMCCIYKHLVFHYPSKAIYLCCCIRKDKCCIRGQRQRPQTQHTKSVGYLDFWSKATPYGV